MMKMMDRRIKRTRAALKRAYIELLKSYKEDEITVFMITDKADINRATFYTHFSNKNDFLEEMLFELLDSFESAIMSAFKEHPKIINNKQTLTTELMFQFIEDNKETFYALCAGHKDFDHLLEKLFYYIFTEKIQIETRSSLGEVNYDIFIHYQTKATLGLILYWIKNNFPHSKEYMIEQLTLLSNTEVISLQKR